MAIIQNISGERIYTGGWTKKFSRIHEAKEQFFMEYLETKEIDDGSLESPVLIDLVRRKILSIVNVENLPQIYNDSDDRDLDNLAFRVKGLINGSIPPGSGGIGSQVLLIDKISSEPESSVTGLTTFITKLTFTPSPGAPFTGDFRLNWYGEYNHDKTNGNTEVQLIRTDVASTLGFASERPTDSNNWNIFSGFINFTLIANSPVFDFQFRTDTPANTAILRRVRLEFFEVV